MCMDEKIEIHWMITLKLFFTFTWMFYGGKVSFFFARIMGEIGTKKKSSHFSCFARQEKHHEKLTRAESESC